MSAELVTAGSIGRGQSTVSVTGRMATSAGAPVTVPLFNVPTGKFWSLTDLSLSTASSTEIAITIQYTMPGGGVTVPIFNASILNTCQTNMSGMESQPTAPAGSAVSMLLPTTASAPSVGFTTGGFLQSAG